MFRLEKKYQTLFIGAIIFLIALFFLTRNVPFFWDAGSKSLRASWFFDNHFSQFVVPTEINAGHPPLWELLLAFFWSLTDRTLENSRLLLLIFNIGAFYQLIRFIRDQKFSQVPIWASILVLIEPTLLAQTTILNNDMMLLFFILLGLNSIYRNEIILYSLALTGVLFSNLRGVCVFGSLLAIDFLYHYFQLKKGKQEFLWISYIAPILIFSGFLVYQQNILGWFLRSPGHEHRNLAEQNLILKNIASIGKSILETGRIFLFGLLGILILRLFKTKNWKNIKQENKRLLVCLVIFLGAFSVLFTLMTNPVNPRYYLIVYLISSILCLNLIFELIQSVKWKKVSVITLFLAFLTGHLWIYPPTISQGWDTSLAYLHYFPLKDKMDDYLVQKGISPTKVGTNLLLNKRSDHYLEPEMTEYYLDLNLSTNPYVILSNIENKTSNEDIRTLMNEWELVESYCQMGVFMNLYKNPSFQD